MKYNTDKSRLIIPEYGRNIQTLIEFSKKVEDREERQAFVEKILDLMQEMHPQSRNVEDYRARLWAHVFRIANYELDVDIPENVTIEPIEKKRPHPINYPDGSVKFRHYGRNVQEMIKKAIAMEDEEKQAEFITVIGSYMKMAYKSWNQPTVSDEIILRDLKVLAGDELEFDEDISLDGIYTYRSKKKRPDNNTNRRSNDRRGGGDNYRRDGRRSNDRRDNRSSRGGGGHSNSNRRRK